MSVTLSGAKGLVVRFARAVREILQPFGPQNDNGVADPKVRPFASERSRKLRPLEHEHLAGDLEDLLRDLLVLGLVQL
ncbi:MAG: hypothetical protein K8I02_08550, partial [Candidatus Methylomirabilis sp.]|nr:hypothetical protein [Deltaproteobacteria bacterium]